jgi:hypothetical protein
MVKIIPLMELFNHTIESKKSLYDLVVVDSWNTERLGGMHNYA